MKILLLHEMSGVHTELKKGLIKLGIDAKIATFGDGFKKYQSDIYLGKSGSGISQNISRLIAQVSNIREFSQYDVIQTISPNPFYTPISSVVERILCEKDVNFVYVAAGSDAIYRKHVQELMYCPPHEWYDHPKEYSRLKSFLGHFSKITPVCWEYYYALKSAGLSPNNVVPFPIDIASHKVRKISLEGKVKIFHPINRPNGKFDFKGTLLIQEAFEILRKKRSNDVEFISVGGLNHKEYSDLTDSVDMIVDQAYSYSYGMSAAYGLAKGQVVLSGLEDVAKIFDHYKECPIINIKPDVNQIVNVVEELISDRYRMRKIAEMSRCYAEKYHDNLKVAETYLDVYSKK